MSHHLHQCVKQPWQEKPMAILGFNTVEINIVGFKSVTLATFLDALASLDFTLVSESVSQ